MLTHLSLFTVIGGMDIAAEWAGFQTVGQCEWADYPTKILEKHWPDVPRWRDIRTLTGESFYERTGLRTVDVISGGFPCQPFSVAGKRRGSEDYRFLWPEMLRVISEIRPTWVFGENVAGLVSMVQPRSKFKVASRTAYREPDADYYERILSRQEDMQLHLIIKDLERIGYEVQPFVIPACAVDAPHRRDRCAIVGYAKHNGSFTAEVDGGYGKVCETDWKEKTHQSSRASVRGNNKIMADSMCDRGQTRAANSSRWEKGETAKSFDCCEIISNSDNRCGNVRGNRELSAVESIGSIGKDNRGRAQKYGGRKWRAAQSGLGGVDDGPAHWLDEPLDIPRVATGIPNRVDRLKALGNMVVPQWAYPIFNAIARIETLMREEPDEQHHPTQP